MNYKKMILIPQLTCHLTAGAFAIGLGLGDEGRTSLTESTNQLNKWLVGVDEIWAQGPAFDIVILENLYEQLGIPRPWNFWQIRDSRTAFSMMPTDPRKAIRTDAHNALADCYYQAKCIQQTFNHFKISK